MKSYAIAEEIFNSHFGSERTYKRSYCDYLTYTEGVMDFQEQLNAYWFVDNVISHMLKVLKSFKDNEFDFFVVEVRLNNNHQGYLEIYTEGYVNDEYNEHISIVKQEIPYIDLPTKADTTVTSYKFYLELASVEPVKFCLLLPREH